jgi:preprotein translocase subunit YajC
LIASAMAQDAAADAPSMLGTFIPLILIIVIFWFLLIRPQMKRNKEHRELVSSLSVGDEVSPPVACSARLPRSAKVL